MRLVWVLVLLAAPAGAADAAKVVFNNETLFEIRAPLGPFAPHERALVLEQRLQRLIRNPYADIAAISVQDGETSSDVLAGDLTLTTVTDQDAAGQGRDRRELARAEARRIREALLGWRERHSARSLVGGALLAVAVTALLVLLLIALKAGSRRLYAGLRAGRGTRIPSLRIQQLELLPAERITAALLVLARGLRLALTLMLLYAYVPLVLSFFPWTSDYAPVLLGYIFTPAAAIGRAAVGYVPNLFFVLVAAVVTRYLLKLVRLIFGEIGKGTVAFQGFYPEWAEPTYKIARFLILALAAVAVYPYVPGSQSPAFKGISVFLGILFSLGSAGAIANMVAGVVLTYMRAFQLGDRVRIADTEGDIVEKTLLVTRVRTPKNVEVSIPNSMVLGSHIINFTAGAAAGGLILHTSVSIGYDAPWRTVHDLLIAAARDTGGILQEPAPFVLQTSLDDFYVTYEVNAYTDQPGRKVTIYAELHANIQDRFNAAGVEIMSPHFTSLRDGNSTAIPEQYLPAGGRARGFRMWSGGQSGATGA